MIRSLLINLDRNPERLEWTTKQLKDLEIHFERIPAFDGYKLSKDEHEYWKKKYPVKRWKNRSSGEEWLKGALGCLFSHRKAWEITAQSNEDFIAVFEDDLYHSPDLKLLFSQTDWIPKDADIIRLEISSERIKLGKKKKIRCLEDKRSIHEIKSMTVYAGAYIITPTAAKKLMSLPDNEIDVVDFLLFSKTHSKISQDMKIYQVSPATSIQDKHLHKKDEDVAFKTNIELYDSEVSLFTGLKKTLHRKAKSIIQVFLGYKLINYTS